MGVRGAVFEWRKGLVVRALDQATSPRFVGWVALTCTCLYFLLAGPGTTLLHGTLGITSGSVRYDYTYIETYDSPTSSFTRSTQDFKHNQTASSKNTESQKFTMTPDVLHEANTSQHKNTGNLSSASSSSSLSSSSSASLNSAHNDLRSNMSSQGVVRLQLKSNKSASTSEANVTQYITVAAFDGRRTGNLLFNLAVLLGTAWHNGFIPVLYEDFMLLREFDFNITLLDNVTEFIMNSKPLPQVAAAKYDPKMEHLRDIGYSNCNITLHGFFQSWKFFRSYQERFREYIRFCNSTVQKAFQFYQSYFPNATLEDGIIPKIRVQGSTLIGIHVRRDDIIQPHFSTFGYTFPEIHYFKKAINYFRQRVQNATFVVCSDDLAWCREHLSPLAPNMVFSTNDLITDLAIMTLSAHTIMSTGTFSWWAAWFTNGTTIYYEDWPMPGTQLNNQVNKEDFFMPHWIPMV